MGNTVGEEAREKERMGCWRGGSNIVYVTIYSQTGSRDDHGTVFFKDVLFGTGLRLSLRPHSKVFA